MAKETTAQRIERYQETVKILAPYVDDDFPSMGNRTPGSIVDDIGPINALLKDLEKAKKTLQNIVDTKMLLTDNGVITGEKYQMKLVPVSQRKLHQETAKNVLEELGRLDECMYDLDMSQHRYKEL